MNKSILLVEDEEHDIIFMQLAMEEAKVTNRLDIVRDGRAAIDYLQGTAAASGQPDYPLPGLVLLDLRLPQTPGLEVLRWIRSKPVFAPMPVMVCSSSNQDSDVERAYALGANGYIVKPGSPFQLMEIVRVLKKYWLDADGPPPNCREWLSVIVGRPAP